MMSRDHMISEGDRSGVDTPSKDEKARNKLRAIIAHLREIETDWGLVPLVLKATAISETRHNLADVVTILMSGEGET